MLPGQKRNCTSETDREKTPEVFPGNLFKRTDGRSHSSLVKKLVGKQGESIMAVKIVRRYDRE